MPTRSGPPDTTRPGSVEADTVAHCDDSTEGDYVHSLTFTELFSGWTENRALWNKSADAVLVQLKELEKVVPYAMQDFHTDNGGEFLKLGAARASNGAGGEACPGRAAAPTAKTTMRTASRRTGRMCGSSSDTIASGIPNWCR